MVVAVVLVVVVVVVVVVVAVVVVVVVQEDSISYGIYFTATWSLYVICQLIDHIPYQQIQHNNIPCQQSWYLTILYSVLHILWNSIHDIQRLKQHAIYHKVSTCNLHTSTPAHKHEHTCCIIIICKLGRSILGNNEAHYYP